MKYQNDSSWIRSGEYTAWYESGNVQMSGQFANDRRAGYWTWYFDLKEPVKMIYGGYREGEMDGEWTFWMLPHNMSNMHAALSGDNPHGGHDMSHTTQSENGELNFDPKNLKPNRVETYRMGKPEGVWMSWFSNGSIADSTSYVNGKLNGTRVSYHENGVKASQSTYDNGKLLAPIQQWDTTGQKVEMKLK